MLDHWPGTTGSYPCWVEPTDSSRNWLNTTWFSQHHHLPCTGINLPCTGKQETFHNQYFCHPQWMARYIQNMLSLSESDEIKTYFHISNGISGNELIFAFPCGKLVTYNTMLLCGRWFHKDNFSFIRFWYRVIFFHPPKRYKKVILCSGKGD